MCSVGGTSWRGLRTTDLYHSNILPALQLHYGTALRHSIKAKM